MNKALFGLQKLVVAATLAALPTLPWAQDKKGEVLPKPVPRTTATPAADATEPEPTLDISVFPGDKHRTVSGGFQVYVGVTNTTKDTIRTLLVGACLPLAVGEVVGKAMLRPPETTKDKPAPKTGDETKQKPGPKTGEENKGAVCRPLMALSAPGVDSAAPVDIPAGRQANFRLDVPRVGFEPTSQHVFFRRDTYPLHFYHYYLTRNDQPAAPRSHRAERAIEIRASILAPLIGLLLGNLLVGVFLAVRDAGSKLVAAIAPPAGARIQGRELGAAVWQLVVSFVQVVVGGFIAGLILVVVLNQTDTPHLPVTVSINDFWGGAFLGLVAYKLSDWLYEKFFKASTNAPPPSGIPNTSPPPSGAANRPVPPPGTAGG
jgi:hypothetical protein